MTRSRVAAGHGAFRAEALAVFASRRPRRGGWAEPGPQVRETIRFPGTWSAGARPNVSASCDQSALFAGVILASGGGAGRRNYRLAAGLVSVEGAQPEPRQRVQCLINIWQVPENMTERVLLIAEFAAARR
jgi:hypothetical protein